MTEPVPVSAVGTGSCCTLVNCGSWGVCLCVFLCRRVVCVWRLPVLQVTSRGAHDVTVMSQRVPTSMCDLLDVERELFLSPFNSVWLARSLFLPNRFGCISEQSSCLIGWSSPSLSHTRIHRWKVSLTAAASASQMLMQRKAGGSSGLPNPPFVKRTNQKSDSDFESIQFWKRVLSVAFVSKLSLL